MNLSQKTLDAIDALIPRYPEKRSASLAILHLIQEECGYVSRSQMEWVADKLGMEAINILGLVTFYPMLREEPAGKIQIKVCRTLPCALRGSIKTAERLQELIGCKLNAVSEDGVFSLEFVECQANCGRAPVVVVDQTMYEGITPDATVEQFAEQIKAQAKGGTVENPIPGTPA